MSVPVSPSEVLGRLIEGVTGEKWAELPDLYAEDTVVEHPYAKPEPTRMEGRERLREHFAHGADLPIRMRARNVVIRQTEDPEVAVAEFEYHAKSTTTGRGATTANVIIARVRDGRIVSSRDYHDHGVLAALLNQESDAR